MTPFPYRILVRWSAEDDAYLAEVPALPGAAADGATQEDAIRAARESVEQVLAVRKEHNDPIPEPDLEEPAYSGQIRLRMPKSLHRKLALRAEQEGVSLNQWMVSLLERNEAVPTAALVQFKDSLRLSFAALDLAWHTYEPSTDRENWYGSSLRLFSCVSGIATAAAWYSDPQSPTNRIIIGPSDKMALEA